MLGSGVKGSQVRYVKGCVCEFWGPRVMGARAKEDRGWVIGFI